MSDNGGTVSHQGSRQEGPRPGPAGPPPDAVVALPFSPAHHGCPPGEPSSEDRPIHDGLHQRQRSIAFDFGASASLLLSNGERSLCVSP